MSVVAKKALSLCFSIAAAAFVYQLYLLASVEVIMPLMVCRHTGNSIKAYIMNCGQSCPTEEGKVVNNLQL